MKAKYLAITAAAAALLLSACQRNELGGGSLSGEEVTVGISAVMPIDGGAVVKSDAEPGKGDEVNRCIMGVYLNDAGMESPVKIGDTVVVKVDPTTHKAEFEDLQLVAGHTYQLVFWADCASGSSDEGFTDQYYSTESFPQVSFKDGVNYESNDDSRDAFFASFALTVDGPSNHTVQLHRPFGQLNIITTDWKVVEDNFQTLLPVKISLEFSNIPNSIDLLTGDLTEGASEETLTSGPVAIANVTPAATDGSRQLSFDYIFAPQGDDQQLVLDDFTMSFLDDAEVEKVSSYTFQNIPVKRNYRTNVSGALLTDRTGIDVEVVPDFNTPDIDRDIKEVTTIEEAEQAITDGATDVVIVEPVNGTIDLPNVAEDLTIRLDGGVDGAIVVQSADESNAFAHEFQIYGPTSGTPQDLNINLSSATAAIRSGHWNEVKFTVGGDAEDAYGMYIADGVVIENFLTNESSNTGRLVLATNPVNIKKWNGTELFSASSQSLDAVKLTAEKAGAAGIFWEASATGDDLRAKLAVPAEYNDGIILAADIEWISSDPLNGAQVNQDCFAIGGQPNSGETFVTSGYEGYIIEGNGHILSGVAYNNVLAIYSGGVTVRDLTVAQPESASRTNAGISVYRAKDVVLENVTVSNCGKAGVIVNASEVSATGLHTSGNAWGGVNISKGGAPSGGPDPVFTFDAASTFSENPAVYVDLSRTGENGYTVNAPAGWNGVKVGNTMVYDDMISVAEGTATVMDAYAFSLGVASGDVSEITVSRNIDLSEVTAEQLIFTEVKTLNIPSGVTIRLGKNYIEAQKGLTVQGGGTLDNTTEPDPATNPGYQKSLIHVMDGDLLIDGVTLINDLDYHWHGNANQGRPYNSAAIAYWNAANVTVKNADIRSGEFTVCGMGRATASGTVTLEDSYFESTSTNRDNGEHWAYAMRLFGSKIRLSNCEVKGVQGAVSIEGCQDAEISSGKYYTVNTEGNKDAFYPLYVTNDAVVVVSGGEFSAANDWSGGLEIDGTSAVVSGDNDVNLPYGSVILKGGKFSGKAYNHVTKAVYQPADGYVYKSTGDSEYPWEVVAE